MIDIYYGDMKPKNQCTDAELSIEFLTKTAHVLRLLAHPCRLKIIEVLERGRSMPVYAIVRQLGLSQAATSQHLNQMRRVGLVRSVRHGREVRYEIADATSLTILGCIRKKSRRAS